jgi:hypothetical protein
VHILVIVVSVFSLVCLWPDPSSQEVSGHSIARHMFVLTRKKGQLWREKKRKKRKKGGNTFISPAITTMCTYVIIIFIFSGELLPDFYFFLKP